MSVFCLAAAQIDEHWDDYCQHIYRMERLGYLGADEIREELKAEKKQLWGLQDGGVRGVCITRIAGKCCEIYAATGKRSKPGQILELYREIEQWARAIGCDRMRVIGRKGWMRMLSNYTQVGIVLEKDLVNEH